MSPSAPTVSCHALGSAPALTASSAGAAAAGLPRHHGTFASGGGMALRNHLPTVAGPFSHRPACPDPRGVIGFRRPRLLWPRRFRLRHRVSGVTVVAFAARLTGCAGLAAPGCCSHRLWPIVPACAAFPSTPGWRCRRSRCCPAGPAVRRVSPLAASCLPACCRWTGAPSWRSPSRLRGDAPWLQAGLPARPICWFQFPPDRWYCIQKLAVTASFPLAFLPPSIPGYR